MTCLLYWLTGLRGIKKKNPIESYVKLCPLKAAILDGGLGHWI